MFDFIFRKDGGFNGNIFKHTQSILKKHNSSLSADLFESPEKLALYLYEIMSPLTNPKKSPKCLNCNNDTKFLGWEHGFSEFCSKTCCSSSRIMLERRTQTNLKKYGFENASQSPEVIAKREATNILKYGHKNVFSSNKIQSKIVETNRSKYNCNYYTQTQEIKTKSKETSYRKYNVDFFQRLKFQNPTDFNRDFICKLANGNVITPELRFYLFNYFKASNYSNFIKSLETLGFEVEKYKPISKAELEMRKAIKEFTQEPCEYNVRTLLKGAKNYPLELDVYIASLSIAFEYNGSYFHKGDKYHDNLTLEEYKTQECKKLGIALHHIWDYEDLYTRLKEIFKGVANESNH